MFAVIYKFKVYSGKEDQFESSWRRMTELIRDHKGGLGSRLHKENDGIYIAYAQWRSREDWANDNVVMPEETKEVARLMKESREYSETIHEMEMIDDLLVSLNN